jgi:hypothetical protein
MAVTTLAGAGVTIAPKDGGWDIQADVYTARIGDNGYLMGLSSGGVQFLAPKGETPGGCYLCMKGQGPLKNVRRDGETKLRGENRWGEIVYEFLPDRVNCTATNRFGEPIAFYFILHPELDAVVANRQKHAPLPTTVQAATTVWLKGTQALEITGSNRAWGPWHNHQVWDARLAKDETRTITLIPRPAKKEELNPPEPLTFTFDVSGNGTVPAQIPLCMIGDSITWWRYGDYWRKYLLEKIPTLAFVGTHTAALGYSHAGEGGNSIDQVIARIDEIPDCPYYHLHIGTNNNNVKNAADLKPRSERAAQKIEELVNLLLKKPSVKKVFLASILPCHYKNPLRDKTNSATNVILRQRLADGAFPAGKVVWVEYEKPVRAWAGWEPKIELHPLKEGYQFMADILADVIQRELQPPDAKPVPKPNSGVRVYNLWDPELGETRVPIIAGWYTVSCELVKVTGDNPRLVVQSTTAKGRGVMNLALKVERAESGKRVAVHFYTREESGAYTRDFLTLKPMDCEVARVVFEKQRPDERVSVYGEGMYIDRTTPPALGELIEQ